ERARRSVADITAQREATARRVAGRLGIAAPAAPLNEPRSTTTTQKENDMTTTTFTKTAPPPWLLDMWKEIDDKTFGMGFDCFAEDAICNLGVADWRGRDAIRNNLRQFIDKGFTALHDVVEYWDSPLLKIFHGKVAMKFDDPGIRPVRPTMTHFFYMDEKDRTKVRRWVGSVGPTGF